MPGLPYGKTTHSNSLYRTPGEHSELEAKFCTYIEELLISILFGMINSDACLKIKKRLDETVAYPICGLGYISLWLCGYWWLEIKIKKNYGRRIKYGLLSNILLA